MIDWGGHRSLFEAEASRLIGIDVRVNGAIDARLLPSPRLTLNDIAIGSEGADTIRARSLSLEFALGPLMRGEWRATELHVTGPQITLGLDDQGRVLAPSMAVRFDPDALAIDRLGIEDGKVILSDAANGASVTLDRLWFNGDARSLIGPLKGEGAASIGGELYPFRLVAGRYSDDTGVRVHINVDPVNHPLSIEADGALALAGGTPRFDGHLESGAAGHCDAGRCVGQPALARQRQDQGQREVGADGNRRLPIRLGGAGLQAVRRGRFQVRQAAALRGRAIRAADRSRPCARAR
ncbi:MAG: AsmA family protein [Pseudolabrys sp.]